MLAVAAVAFGTRAVPGRLLSAALTTTGGGFRSLRLLARSAPVLWAVLATRRTAVTLVAEIIIAATLGVLFR